jgi:hypothetical protein
MFFGIGKGDIEMEISHISITKITIGEDLMRE